MPLALTDAQLNQILLAARPLRLRDRDDFLKEVAKRSPTVAARSGMAT